MCTAVARDSGANTSNSILIKDKIDVKSLVVDVLSSCSDCVWHDLRQRPLYMRKHE